MADFNFRVVNWQCTCGTESGPVQIGVSSMEGIVAQWICSGCRRPRIATLSFEEMMLAVPPSPTDSTTEFTTEDREALKEMKIYLDNSP